MQELIKNVIKWAEDKNLLHPENAPKQYLKIIEEIGETCRAILKDDKAGQKDGLGDTMVTLIIYANQTDKEVDFDMEDLHTNCVEIEDTVQVIVDYINQDIDYSMFWVFRLCAMLGFTPEECLQAAWDRKDLSFIQWLNHLQEELMDAALYVEKIKVEYDTMNAQIESLAYQSELTDEEFRNKVKEILK